MISELRKSSSKEAIACAFHQCRAKTLAVFEGMDETTFCHLAHPDFSPVGWHLGHIAYTESLWLLERSAGFPCLFPQYRKLFAADGLPKTERVKLPNQEEILDYLNSVREKVIDCLEVADLEQQERLWRFLLQHESQHSEIITFVLEMCKLQPSTVNRQPSTVIPTPLPKMIHIPAGEFEMGNDSIDALDNERPMHRVYLEAYLIDRYPVTCGQYRAFIEAKGYQNPCWWSQAGWKWLQTEQVKQPLYWCNDSKWDHHPVCGVSWYEAEAYSQFVGKRLPTEAEWEKAASCNTKVNYQCICPWDDKKPILAALGNVWEWTASWFDGYPGFQSYPYIGYSQVYFDQKHRVLKGGSWATASWVLRSSFRNWYYPSVRQIFAGFRCAADC